MTKQDPIYYKIKEEPVTTTATCEVCAERQTEPLIKRVVEFGVGVTILMLLACLVWATIKATRELFR